MQKINTAKLHWQCRRGMLELDLILGHLLEFTYPQLTQGQQLLFEQMLSADDPTLYAWLIGAELPLSKPMRELVMRCIQDKK